MKIAVLVKIVDGEINPFDASAVEHALSLGGEVAVLSMGPSPWVDTLQPLTRIGVSRAILLSDPAFAGSDTLATATVLKAALDTVKPDLILCGRKTLDGETAQVGPCLAGLMGLPVLTGVFSFAIRENTVEAKTVLGEETAALPAVLTFERTKQLRLPSLFSRAGEVEVWDNAKLGVDPARCGLRGSPTRVIETTESVRGERSCKKIAPEELVPLLRSLLQREKRVKTVKESETKLKNAWAIGREVLDAARAIAKTVTLIENDDPAAVAEKAKAERPEVILWNADARGRRNAPIVQALLGTGLCADCTDLATDGEKLYMIRPAKGGNITAKIRCDTRPQMATVRTVDGSSGDLIVSAGRGVADDIERVRELARLLGGEFGASRALVDLGRADYPEQVGLTGRMVAPKVYLAIGISGAVQHAVGLRDADTVIAVNPDEGAPIFGCADYGIVAPFEELYREIEALPKGEKNDV